MKSWLQRSKPTVSAPVSEPRGAVLDAVEDIVLLRKDCVIAVGGFTVDVVQVPVNVTAVCESAP